MVRTLPRVLIFFFFFSFVLSFCPLRKFFFPDRTLADKSEEQLSIELLVEWSLRRWFRFGWGNFSKVKLIMVRKSVGTRTRSKVAKKTCPQLLHWKGRLLGLRTFFARNPSETLTQRGARASQLWRALTRVYDVPFWIYRQLCTGPAVNARPGPEKTKWRRRMCRIPRFLLVGDPLC